MRMGAILVVVGLAAGLGTSLPSLGQTERDKKVRNDRDQFQGSTQWIYNDLEAARALARERNRPLLVVFRCIPCENCHELDEQVAERDPAVRDLLDRYICVRIVQANGLDLLQFQFDFDQSFSAVLMHPDGTVLGRFGTRSGRQNEKDDISLDGLRATLEAGMELFGRYDAEKAALEGKQVQQARFAAPEEYPRLRGKYKSTLDYEGSVAASCIHCHMVGEAEKAFFRDNRQPIPDDVLFPYPNPRILGFEMDPLGAATVRAVTPGSPAEKAGFQAGDRIERFDGQPPVSTADLQWVLQHSGDRKSVPVQVGRAGQAVSLEFPLPEGWRRLSDLSWRATTWDLRRMAFGGMVLEDLPEADRKALGIGPDELALRVKHVGQYGEHARAKRAGIQAGDVVVRYDELKANASETQLLAHALQKKSPGDQVEIELLREGMRKTVQVTLQ